MFQKEAQNGFLKAVLGLCGVPAPLQQRGAVTGGPHLRDRHSPLGDTEGWRPFTDFSVNARAQFENCGSNIVLLKALDTDFLLNVLNTNKDF